MQSNFAKVALVVVAIALVIVLFVVLGGDDDSDETTTQATQTTSVAEEGDAGDEVRFEVQSDIAEHVHVHGYDVIQDVEPGKPVVFAFPAEIEGVFEVELEDSATQIAELTVNPG